MRIIKEGIHFIHRNNANYIIMPKKYYYLRIIVSAIGLIILSVSISFGRWNELSSLENNYNNHAYLLGLCGVNFIFVGSVFLEVLKRLKKIEDKLNIKNE